MNRYEAIQHLNLMYWGAPKGWVHISQVYELICCMEKKLKNVGDVCQKKHLKVTLVRKIKMNGPFYGTIPVYEYENAE